MIPIQTRGTLLIIVRKKTMIPNATPTKISEEKSKNSVEAGQIMREPAQITPEIPWNFSLRVQIPEFYRKSNDNQYALPYFHSFFGLLKYGCEKFHDYYRDNSPTN